MKVYNKWGRELRTWDGGFGPLWVYQDSSGVVGVVRAMTWYGAYEYVISEILPDADPNDPDSYASSYDPTADPNDLAEGVHFRGGEPANEGLTSYLAREDLNGSSLRKLTLERAIELELRVDLEER